MIPLQYEIPFAIEKVNNWDNKNILQKFYSCLKYKYFGGLRPSPTQCQRRIVYLISKRNDAISGKAEVEE